MVVEPFVSLPRWLYLGVAAGVLVSVVVAVTFLVARRLFPDRGESAGGGQSGRSTEAIRRTEIREYLNRIDERFVEDAEVAGNRVAFLLPHRDVAVTFDARTFLALERAPTHVILAEHEMPGVALGNRLPFETPELSFGPEDPAGREERVGAADAAYDVLGLSSGADEEAVRRAYRRRVKEVHPDQGGDEEEFQRVQEAYDAARRYAS
ncbi:J domain-containing protein [Natronomonas marina]|uniref:J domain-containing protein n=1 Tax=Natronomonas marina TaxID=2961939 RepID=UPI0020C97B7D|nr:J domain-containing protein [Natronomonas marina]